MPRLLESDLRKLVAKARLIGCTQYLAHPNGVWCFFDAEGWLRLQGQPDKPDWMGKLPYPDQYTAPLSDLRKKI